MKAAVDVKRMADEGLATNMAQRAASCSGCVCTRPKVIQVLLPRLLGAALPATVRGAKHWGFGLRVGQRCRVRLCKALLSFVKRRRVLFNFFCIPSARVCVRRRSRARPAGEALTSFADSPCLCRKALCGSQGAALLKFAGSFVQGWASSGNFQVCAKQQWRLLVAQCSKQLTHALALAWPASTSSSSALVETASASTSGEGEAPRSFRA